VDERGGLGEEGQQRLARLKAGHGRTPLSICPTVWPVSPSSEASDWSAFKVCDKIYDTCCHVAGRDARQGNPVVICSAYSARGEFKGADGE
jgi:hypothetical protein